ncbi:hypothetical protein H2198_006292 [Neophaeococcomyces mojaviensis]|uniref:Uncharacterized protein n=1 Tax=Neophaeococcomyces mojaviensis TaxID=3383035 RepID=A0ACC3A390_9EURO|nr:hypothetical protein H2198_006292 [Knufia sp. JES_112]
MSLPLGDKFPRDQHDCYRSTDPRVNEDIKTSLLGKNAMVVGAGRGIGRACCEFLVLAGVKSIACLALEKTEAEETAKICQGLNPTVQVISIAADNRNFSIVRDIVEDTEKNFGSIDILLMNAGRPPQFLPTSLSDPEIWWQTVSVSLQGAFNFSRAVLPLMQRQRSGCIIFTSSSGAHTNNGMSSYVLAKLSQVRLAEILHVENFQQFGIKTFAFNPGCVRTRFFTDFEDKVLGKAVSEASYVAKNVALEDVSANNAYTALKDQQFDSPYTAAGLVTTLASGKLDFMSGRYLDAAVDIEHYINSRDEILKHDLCRVRLVLSATELIPHCQF